MDLRVCMERLPIRSYLSKLFISVSLAMYKFKATCSDSYCTYGTFRSLR